MERFLEEPEHTARAEGWIDAAGCGGRCQVERGWFNLFSPVTRRIAGSCATGCTSPTGRAGPAPFPAGRTSARHPATRVWPDTTTLYFRLLAGHVTDGEDDNAEITGAGILHLGMDDFARQLSTFRTKGPHGLAAVERFAGFFLGELWNLYRPAAR